ncbi:MAG TPA: YraN family protein [Planctomycetota bacterium]|nr:YraN family protein [Planctomycetota bacterium]
MVKDPRQELGAAGEDAACRLLRKSGYRVLERNWRNKWGEIDAVAWEADELVFVEVRSRSSEGFGTGAESVDPRKQRQIVRAAKMYFQEKRLDPVRQPCRFDVVEMLLGPDGAWKGEIIKGAFAAE